MGHHGILLCIRSGCVMMSSIPDAGVSSSLPYSVDKDVHLPNRVTPVHDVLGDLKFSYSLQHHLSLLYSDERYLRTSGR
jgi:hypothetical protein